MSLKENRTNGGGSGVMSWLSRILANKSIQAVGAIIRSAYMTRQVHEWGREKYGFRGHITSLNPIRPENAPDPWEKQALESFEQGNKQSIALAEFDDGQYVRFMRPVTTEAWCLKCHGQQGYQVGDIRGRDQCLGADGAISGTCPGTVRLSST